MTLDGIHKKEEYEKQIANTDYQYSHCIKV